MVRIEVKHDSIHRKWQRLSVHMLPAMAELYNRPALEMTCKDYLAQYSIDHQMNPHMVAVRAVDDSTGEILFTHVSNATANRP